MEWDSCDHSITVKDYIMEKHQAQMDYLLSFTKTNWIDIKLLLLESIEHATKNGELSIEQKRGIITLVPKRDKSRNVQKNWRPI